MTFLASDGKQSECSIGNGLLGPWAILVSDNDQMNLTIDTANETENSEWTFDQAIRRAQSNLMCKFKHSLASNEFNTKTPQNDCANLSNNMRELQNYVLQSIAYYFYGFEQLTSVRKQEELEFINYIICLINERKDCCNNGLNDDITSIQSITAPDSVEEPPFSIRGRDGQCFGTLPFKDLTKLFPATEKCILTESNLESQQCKSSSVRRSKSLTIDIWPAELKTKGTFTTNKYLRQETTVQTDTQMFILSFEPENYWNRKVLDLERWMKDSVTSDDAANDANYNFIKSLAYEVEWSTDYEKDPWLYNVMRKVSILWDISTSDINRVCEKISLLLGFYKARMTIEGKNNSAMVCDDETCAEIRSTINLM